MEVKLLSGALGAEIEGIDLKDASDENFKKINELLLEHKVIFFRDQKITEEEHMALAEKFGPLETHAYVKGLDACAGKAYLWAKDKDIIDSSKWNYKCKPRIKG